MSLQHKPKEEEYDIGDFVFLTNDKKPYKVVFQVVGLPGDSVGYTLITSSQMPGGQKIVGPAYPEHMERVSETIENQVLDQFPELVWAGADRHDVEGNAVLKPDTNQAIEDDIALGLAGKKRRRDEPVALDGAGGSGGAGRFGRK